MKLLFTILFLTLSATDAVADESAVVNAEKISSQVMSPYCPGRTLSACPSDSARQLRGQIEQWFSQGYTETAVRNQLQMIYGQEVFGVPEKKGVGLLGWYAPAAFFVIGLLIVILFLKRRMNMLTENDSSSTTFVSDEKRESIERELKKRMEEG